METQIGKRFEELMRSEGLNNNTFSIKIGVTQPAISKIISGDSKPSFAVLEKTMEMFPNVNPSWLLLGKGKMLLDENGEIIVDEKSVWAAIQGKYEQMYSELKDSISSRDLMLDELRHTIEDLRYTVNLQKSILGKFNPAPDDQSGKIISFESFATSVAMLKFG